MPRLPNTRTNPIKIIVATLLAVLEITWRNKHNMIDIYIGMYLALLRKIEEIFNAPCVFRAFGQKKFHKPLAKTNLGEGVDLRKRYVCSLFCSSDRGQKKIHTRNLEVYVYR